MTEGDYSPWIGVPWVVGIAGFAWPIGLLRRRGLNLSLLPPLTMPLAVVGLGIGGIGLLAAIPLYQIPPFLRTGRLLVRRRRLRARLRALCRGHLGEADGLLPLESPCRRGRDLSVEDRQRTGRNAIHRRTQAAGGRTSTGDGGLAGCRREYPHDRRPGDADSRLGVPATDVLGQLTAKDDRYWESGATEQGPGQPLGRRTELLLEFPKPEDARQAKLVMKVANTPWASSSSAGISKLACACYPLMNAVRSAGEKRIHPLRGPGPQRRRLDDAGVVREPARTCLELRSSCWTWATCRETA